MDFSANKTCFFLPRNTKRILIARLSTSELHSRLYTVSFRILFCFTVLYSIRIYIESAEEKAYIGKVEQRVVSQKRTTTGAKDQEKYGGNEVHQDGKDTEKLLIA